MGRCFPRCANRVPSLLALCLDMSLLKVSCLPALCVLKVKVIPDIVLVISYAQSGAPYRESLVVAVSLSVVLVFINRSSPYFLMKF